MEPNDSNMRPQQTGGLKLMTVFIFVLALHVVVIGGFAIYHLMSGGSADADLATIDKAHKGLKNADGTVTTDSGLSDAIQSDKSTTSAPAPAPSTEVATVPANPSTATTDTTAAAESTTPAPAPVAAPTPTPAANPAPPTPAPTVIAPMTPAPVSAPAADVASQVSPTPSNSIPPALAPPPEPTPVAVASAPAPAPVESAPTPDLTSATPSGPVHMPADTASAPATTSAPAHEHLKVYVVKITDSYKKIAHAHHVSVAQLKEANHIRGDVLHTGQKLVIPSAGTAVAESESSSTASLSSGSSPSLDGHVTASFANLSSGPSSESRTALHHHVYTVVKGDTLIRIAHRFRTTATALMAENSITDPSKLAIGKKLKIPSQESRSARIGVPASTQPAQVQTTESAPSGQLANFVP